jgi:hypothetical protein
VREVDEGLSTGGKPEVELIGGVLDMSADVLEARSNFARFSAGRRVRFSDLAVPAFVALGSEVAGGFNRNVVAADGSRSSTG